MAFLVFQIQESTAKTDNKAPHLPVSVYIKDAAFYSDISRLRNLECQNRKLLVAINVLYRTKVHTTGHSDH
ncbi:hypothetical protein J6590_087347 [Homalodisca vitripennis]|nr:hypothetical protein J6590_087347 [Homalodisca vitripennis]